MFATKKLRNGQEAFAKECDGSLSAVTYVNMTQAKKVAEKMGEGWKAHKPCGFGRAFFVVRVQV